MLRTVDCLIRTAVGALVTFHGLVGPKQVGEIPRHSPQSPRTPLFVLAGRGGRGRHPHQSDM